MLGGQYYYGPWVMDKATVHGTDLVWAFFGYSQIYGRATGLFELGPAILILIPRTAAIGAAALFAVSLNITVMDFTYHLPAVKYLALLYTVPAAGLLWVDRHKLALLLESNAHARAALALVAVGVFIIGAVNLLASSMSGVPTVAARQMLEPERPGAKVEPIGYRMSGFIGVRWFVAMDFQVAEAGRVDTVTGIARKTTGFLPWRVDSTARTGQTP